MNLGEFDSEISDLNEKMAKLRKEDAEINEYINSLENGLRLDEEEQLKLAEKVYELLGKRG